MKATLIKHAKTIGTTNVPKDTYVIVVQDTRGYASDVYIYSEYDDAFLYSSSTWIGLDEIKKV